MTSWTAQLQEMVISFLFPSRCIGCGKTSALLCESCCQKLPKISPPICNRCGKPESTATLCPACWGWQSQIDDIRSVFHFEGVMRQVIHEFKYRNLRTVSGHIAELMFNHLQSNPMPGEVLVPVPLYKKRLRQCGYNQLGLIVDELSKVMNIPVIKDCLI